MAEPEVPGPTSRAVLAAFLGRRQRGRRCSSGAPTDDAMHRTAPRRRVGWRPEPAPATELSALLSLPQDCLTAVLAALPPLALANTCGASRSLRHAASDPKLWAPHCRVQWPEDEDQAPSRLQYGRRSRLFTSLTICSTHLAPHAKLVAEAAVEAMGGRWEGDLTTAATHLLCGAAFSAKSRGASSNTYATQGSNPRLVCHTGLEPQTSRQGPRRICYSHVRASPWTAARDS